MHLYKKITLKNGLRLLLSPSNNTDAVTILILVGAGSRYENADTNGLAHFLEHMFFKGAKKYPRAKDVSEAIDSVGGEFNAFTGKEYVGYYVKLAKQHVSLGFEVLSDMLLHSKLDAREIERERGVILEEINMYEDNPMAKIEEEFESLMYGDAHPLGWKIAGPKNNIRKLSRAQFVDYQRKFYTPDNIVISVAGNFSPMTARRSVEKLFTFPLRKKTAQWEPFAAFPEERVRIVHRPTEQAHIYLGMPGFGAEDPRRYAATILGSIMGGGMSSRLFLSVRERRGLCYYISSSFSLYRDSGHFETRAGVDLTRVDQAITAILREFKKMRAGTVSPQELRKGKEYIKGQTTLRLEASEEIAEFLGKQELLKNKIETVQQQFAYVDAVTSSQVTALAREILRPGKIRLALIGPYDNPRHFEKFLNF